MELDPPPVSLPEKVRQSFADIEANVHKDPLRAALFAAGGGFILSRLPLLAIFAGLVRLAFWLIRPALLVLGIAKIVELSRAKNS